MKFDINSYAAVLYVDKNGKDDLSTNDGSKENPFLTPEFAKSQVNTDNTVVIIGKGEYLISNIFQRLSSNEYKISYCGKSEKTILIIKNINSSYSNYLGDADFFNLTIKLSDTCSGDTRTIIYSIDTYLVNFYNVLFLCSDNGKYPTENFIFNSNVGMTEKNKHYYNCTFLSTNSVNVVSSIGLGHYHNCATNAQYYLDTSYENNAQYIIDSQIDTSVKNCEFKGYQLTSNNNLYGVYSGDNAWIKNLFLIKENNKFYSIKPEKYADGKYVELTNDEVQNNFEALAFEVDELVSEITIDSETFKPINKFSKIKLVSNTKFEGLFLKSIKSNKQLIVASNNFSTSISEHIDYFKAVYEKNTNSSIKLAFSTDNGLTWKGNNFEDLSIEIPLKPYSELSEEEKTKWNNAKESIHTNGIPIEDLESLDFNTLDFEYIRFAYVLSITDASDVCNTSKLQWQFDAKGSMQLMDSTEIGIEVLSDSIKVTPKTEEELIKVNITNGACDGGGGSSDIEDVSQEDLNELLGILD